MKSKFRLIFVSEALFKAVFEFRFGPGPLFSSGVGGSAGGSATGSSSFRFTQIVNGGGGTVQFEPYTVVREYRIQWEKERLNLSELAKLRWVKRWSVERIARHLGWSYYQTHGRLKRLARRGRNYVALSAEAKKIVTQHSKLRFHGRQK